MELGGRAKISIPELPSPAPNRRKHLMFQGHQKKEPPNSMIPKKSGNNTNCCSDKGIALAMWWGWGWGLGGTTAGFFTLSAPPPPVHYPF